LAGVEPDLVGQPGGQSLLGDADLTSRFHVLAVRDRAGVLCGGLDAAGDDVSTAGGEARTGVTVMCPECHYARGKSRCKANSVMDTAYV
jgi:hypothetical protein